MPALRHRAAHFLLKKAGMFHRSYREEAYGRSFVVPIINGRKTYVSEPWIAEALRRVLPLKPGAFIDVGVNLGQTMLKLAAIDPARAYLGFEPNPACADYAFALIRANALPYTVIPAGLGVRTDIVMLQSIREEDTDPSASIVDGFRDNPVLARRPVMIVGWDDLPEAVVPGRIAVVKIDVEGGETEVVEGIEGMLASHRPFVFIEILPPYTADNRFRLDRQGRVEQVLERLDYAIFRLLRARDGGLAGLERLGSFGLHGDLALCDYLLAPREDSDRVTALFAPAN